MENTLIVMTAKLISGLLSRNHHKVNYKLIFSN